MNVQNLATLNWNKSKYKMCAVWLSSYVKQFHQTWSRVKRHWLLEFRCVYNKWVPNMNNMNRGEDVQTGASWCVLLWTKKTDVKQILTEIESFLHLNDSIMSNKEKSNGINSSSIFCFQTFVFYLFWIIIRNNFYFRYTYN